MSRICPTLAILTLVVPALFADEPKPARPKHEFYRPDLETMRKNLPLKKVKTLAADKDDVHQLTAVEADMLIPDGVGNRKVRLFSYNSQAVGPTIVTTPGTKLKVRVTNNLIPKPDEPAVPGVNDFHGFNVTNLHTHGLNVTPRDPGDNVFREIRQNFSHLFRYELPADQVPGTYFYHPHKHGSVGYQVACGMVGALIVKDETKGLDSLPELRKASDVVLVLQQLDMHQNTLATRCTR